MSRSVSSCFYALGSAAERWLGDGLSKDIDTPDRAQQWVDDWRMRRTRARQSELTRLCGEGGLVESTKTTKTTKA